MNNGRELFAWVAGIDMRTLGFAGREEGGIGKEGGNRRGRGRNWGGRSLGGFMDGCYS